MNGCFSGTSSRKSPASSMVQRSAPTATSTTSAKPSSFNASVIFSGGRFFPNCPTNAGATGRINGNAALDGLNGLENLSLISNGSKRTVYHAHATGDTGIIIDLGPAQLVRMDCPHTTGFHTGPLQFDDSSIGADRCTAATLDTFLPVNIRPPLYNGDCLLRAYFRTGMCQAALTGVRYPDFVFRTGRAGSLDDIDQRSFIKPFCHDALLDSLLYRDMLGHITDPGSPIARRRRSSTMARSRNTLSR